ncbi:MAG: phosphodiesterase [Panacagrimonas sp.]
MRLGFLLFPLTLYAPLAAIAQSTTHDVPEIVVVTQGSAPASTPILPTKGMNKSAVVSRYGQPATKRPPVGGSSRQQPPITRWDYDGYSVFFEYDHVVDTVQRGNPAPIAVYDGLAGGPR